MAQALNAGPVPPGPGPVQLAGGVEHIERINPQAGPAPCPPGHVPVPCPPANPNAPMAPPVAVQEPAPGQHSVIEVVPNQPLIFDFNPLDLKATQHEGSVTLTFPDGAQLELHDIVGPCGVQPTPFQLPDGTVISPADLLQAFHLNLLGPCGVAQINPTAGPTTGPGPGNTGFEVGPYEVGGIGPGLNGSGPLPPTGFGYGAEFLHGTGGSPLTPTTPTPPPPGTFLTVNEDVQSGVYDSASMPITGSGDYFTDVNPYTHQPVVSSSPAASVASFSSVYSGQPGTFGTPLEGQFGALTMNANGVYSYAVDAAHQAAVSQIGTDQISQELNNIGPVPSTYPLQDIYDVTSTNGYVDASQQLVFDVYGADVLSTAASAGVTAAAATTLLLTYTDAVDPAHSFQQLVTVSGGGTVTVTPESSTYVQPNDPALLSISYVSGAAATVNNIDIEGVTYNAGGVTLGAGGNDAVTGVLNPILNALGDTGDTLGGASGAQISQNAAAASVALSSANVTAYTDSASGHTEEFGYLYDNNNGSTAMTAVGSGATVDVLAIDGTQNGATTMIGSDAAGSSNIFQWDSASLLSNAVQTSLDINGGTGGGLNTLSIESPTAQDLAFGTNLTSGTNVQNIQVFDLTDGANPSVNNSITLSAADVLTLAQNEPVAVQSFGGGALSVWINGTAADHVDLTGASWSAISGPTTSGGQTNQPATNDGTSTIAAGTNNGTQMVGYTEYAATVGGQTVHVYVENAIAQAGHVAHA
jgi:VCBS repeat-containing protein